MLAQRQVRGGGCQRQACTLKLTPTSNPVKKPIRGRVTAKRCEAQLVSEGMHLVSRPARGAQEKNSAREEPRMEGGMPYITNLMAMKEDALELGKMEAGKAILDGRWLWNSERWAKETPPGKHKS
ncbi:uncharacterized protein LOC144495495 [Mustelus asterias]